MAELKEEIIHLSYHWRLILKRALNGSRPLIEQEILAVLCISNKRLTFYGTVGRLW